MLIENLDWDVRLGNELREVAMLFGGEQRRSSGTELVKRPHTQRFKVKLAGVAVDKYVMVIEKAKADKRITNDRPSLTLPVRNLSHNKVQSWRKMKL